MYRLYKGCVKYVDIVFNLFDKTHYMYNNALYFPHCILLYFIDIRATIKQTMLPSNPCYLSLSYLKCVGYTNTQIPSFNTTANYYVIIV